MDSFILIFKGLQEYGFHNYFALPIVATENKATNTA